MSCHMWLCFRSTQEQQELIITHQKKRPLKSQIESMLAENAFEICFPKSHLYTTRLISKQNHNPDEQREESV